MREIVAALDAIGVELSSRSAGVRAPS
jgi:hypothetical protein